MSEDRSGFVHASWNDGRGGFQAGSRIAPGGLLAAADLDGDRKVDLAIDDPSALERRVLRNAGGRAFERGAVIPRFENYGRFVVLDADGDQDPDLVGFSGESKLAVLPGNGRDAFAPPFLLDGGLPNQGRLRFPADFNGDGQIDVVVLAPGCLLSILFNRTLPARSKDADRDGIPDECPAAAGGQIPADANQDGKLDLSDAVWVLNRLFHGAASPWPCDGGLDPSPAPADVRLLDSNGDGALDVADPIALLRHFFFGGEPPALGTRCVAITGCPERCIG